jgi:hypothetical protein
MSRADILSGQNNDRLGNAVFPSSNSGWANKVAQTTGLLTTATQFRWLETMTTKFTWSGTKRICKKSVSKAQSLSRSRALFADKEARILGAPVLAQKNH